MNKDYTKLYNAYINLLKKWKNWYVVFLFGLILIYLFGLYGECFIHESGHKITGKILGCSEVDFDCKDKTEKVFRTTGWESCPFTMFKEEGRITCNYQSILATLGGFIFFTTIFLMIYYLINFILVKIGIKLEKKFKVLLILLILIESFQVAGSDFYKILTCANLDSIGLIILKLSFKKIFFRPFLLLALGVLLWDIIKKQIFKPKP